MFGQPEISLKQFSDIQQYHQMDNHLFNNQSLPPQNFAEINQSPLSLPTIPHSYKQPQKQKKTSPDPIKNYSLFSRVRLENILSNKKSFTTHEKSRKELRPLKSLKKISEGVYDRNNNYKLRREKQLKQLRNQSKDISLQFEKKIVVDKYKNIKPRLMNHTEKVLPSIPAFSDIAIPELQSSEVLNDYKIISHVGKGGFSIVSAAINKKNMNRYAIKTYTKINQMDNPKIMNIQAEVRNLFALKHENIIDLKHAVKDGKKIQLIMENGGKQSLSGLLRKVQNFDEEMAKKYFKQIADAIAFCHDNSISHRDLKLENILVDDDGKVKLIDFGFSTRCKRETRLTSFCGTPPYMSPELAAKIPYNGLSSDVWALGVTLYLLTVGKFPFRAGNERELYRLIQQGKYKIKETMSFPLRDLLASMLKVDEKQRATAKDIVNSEWLQK